LLPYFILASAGDPRVTAFQLALKKQQQPAATVLSYLDLIQSSDNTVAALGQAPCILRIDSTGRCQQTYRQLLIKGGAVLQANQQAALSPSQVNQQCKEKGRIIAPQQLYAGYHAVLSLLNSQLNTLNTVQLMNHPSDILLAQDKVSCHQHLSHHSVPVPQSLGHIQNYDQLREVMQQLNIPRIFIKQRHSSAASGIIALETSGSKIQVKTTIETNLRANNELALFNTRRLRHLNNEADIATLVNSLCTLGVHVERWIPKAQVSGLNVDLRILMIKGKACHKVLRLSKTPMTNLHLLNQRDSADTLKQKMTTQAWDAMINSCEKAAQCFPQSLYVALDVVVSIGLKKHAIIEVNALGDFLKDTYYQGFSPQELEIASLAEVS